MKNNIKLVAFATVLAMSMTMALATVSAQTTTQSDLFPQINQFTGTSATSTGTIGTIAPSVTPGVMPILYNQSGSPVNTVTGQSLPAGWYYLQGGRQIYYYGNGTYYDPTAMQYGGSVSNPNGTAGVILGTYDVGQTGTGGTGTPGLPNTGIGDQSIMTWVMLLMATVITLTSIGYLVRTRNSASRS